LYGVKIRKENVKEKMLKIKATPEMIVFQVPLAANNGIM